MPCNERNNHMTIARFALSDIAVEPSIQSRSSLIHPPTVTRYRNTVRAAGGDVELIRLPPVTLARLGPSTLYLVDGFHRYAAHEAEGVETIAAQVVEVGSVEEAKWLAAQGNLRNGLPLTPKESREAFRRFICARCHEKADPEAKPGVVRQRPKPNVMTLGAIGMELGKPKSTIHRWMENDFPRIHRSLYGKGQEEPVDWDSSSCTAPPPMRELTPLEVVNLSLENVERILNGQATSTARGKLLERLASTLADAALPARLKDEEATLNVTLEDALFGTRKVVVRVSVEEVSAS